MRCSGEILKWTMQILLLVLVEDYVNALQPGIEYGPKIVYNVATQDPCRDITPASSERERAAAIRECDRGLRFYNNLQWKYKKKCCNSLPDTICMLNAAGNGSICMVFVKSCCFSATQPTPFWLCASDWVQYCNEEEKWKRDFGYSRSFTTGTGAKSPGPPSTSHPSGSRARSSSSPSRHSPVVSGRSRPSDPIPSPGSGARHSSSSDSDHLRKSHKTHPPNTDRTHPPNTEPPPRTGRRYSGPPGRDPPPVPGRTRPPNTGPPYVSGEAGTSAPRTERRSVRFASPLTSQDRDSPPVSHRTWGSGDERWFEPGPSLQTDTDGARTESLPRFTNYQTNERLREAADEVLSLEPLGCTQS